MNTVINAIETIAKRHFTHAHSAHDWYHTLRVLNNALILSEGMNCDIVVIKVAALLHDIGRIEEERVGEHHAILGAKMAHSILKHYIEDLGENRVNNIIHSIESHGFRSNKQPETLEAKILSDADKLDALGAIGIARIFAYGGRYSWPLYPLKWHNVPGENDVYTPYDEYEKKLKNLPDMMYTARGKSIAIERLKFIETFFERLKEDIKGI